MILIFICLMLLDLANKNRLFMVNLYELSIELIQESEQLLEHSIAKMQQNKILIEHKLTCMYATVTTLNSESKLHQDLILTIIF